MTRRSCLTKLDNDLDVIWFSLQGVGKVLGTLAARHQVRKPRSIGASQRNASLVPMTLVGIDAADDGFIP